MPTRNDLHALLKVGKENGLTAKALAATLDVPERRVRELVSELRMAEVAVCGHPKTGYFIAANQDELEATCEFHHSRAMHSLLIVSKLRKVPLSALMGQQRLEVD